MTRSPPLLIAADTKGRQETLHESTKIRLLGLQEQVKMIGHATIGEDSDAKFSCEVPKLFNEHFVVPLIMKDNSALIAAVYDMITSTRIFDSEWTCHR